MFIQAMMSIALCFSVFALVTISTTIMHFLNRYQIIVIGSAFIFEVCASELYLNIDFKYIPVE
jgi:predicted tellurium resistance membrane protein TerC